MKKTMKTYDQLFETERKPKKQKDTPLIKAVFTSNPNIVKKLLESGEDPNVRGAEGWLPIHYAAMDGKRTKIIEILVQYGANINAETVDENDPNYGRISKQNISTPIYLARYFGGKESVKLLINLGANVSDAFSSIQDLLGYFNNDISWWENAPESYKRTKKVRDIFGK